MIKISVVIPTHNRSKLLRRCLRSLSHQNFDKDKFEVIVIDDASNDDTAQVVKKFQYEKFFTLNYLRLEKKLGVAAARNLGIKHAKGEIVAFTDSDCILSKNWLKNICMYYARSEDIFAIEGRIVNALKRNRFAFTEQKINEYCRNFITYSNSSNIFIVDFNTANCSIKKEAIDIYQLSFDKKFFVAEDADFRNQLLQNSIKILYISKILVAHFHRADPISFIKQNFYRGIGEHLLESKWNFNKRAIEKTYYDEKKAVVYFFLQFLKIEGGIKGLILFLIYILRKAIRTLGYLVEKNRIFLFKLY